MPDTNSRPRLSFWYWLFHPIKAYRIMTMVWEALRREPRPADPAVLTNAEMAVAGPAIKVAAAARHRGQRRVNRLANQHAALINAIKRELSLAARERARTRTPVVKHRPVPIPPMTVDEARTVIRQNHDRIKADLDRGDTHHLDRPSKVRRGTAYGLLAADIVAISTTLAKVFNLGPGSFDLGKISATVGFSLITALVLALLAHTTGHSMWQWRSSAATQREPARKEFPPRKSLLWAKLLSLAAVSVGSGVSIAARVLDQAKGFGSTLAWTLAIIVALAAVTGPWLVVLDEMRSGSLEVRTVEALTKMVQDVEDACTDHEKKADDLEKQRDALQGRAEDAIADIETAYGPSRARAKSLIYRARSLHGAAGGYAMDPDDPTIPDYLAPHFDLDLAPLDDALRRLQKDT